MTCPNEGILRARLDKDLSGTELEQVNLHLDACAECRDRSDKLAHEATHARELLGALDPRSDEPLIDADLAYASFRHHLSQGPQLEPSWLSRWFAPRWRPAWGLVSAALVVSVLVGFNPARTWAQRILAMLRVQKITVVSIDPSTLISNAEPDSRPYRLINQFISDNVVVTMDPGQPDIAPNVATASKLVGFHVRILNRLGAPQRVQVNGEAAFQMNLNRDRIEALLEEVGRSDIQIPESANGALVAVHIPKSAISMYGDCPVPRTHHTSPGQSSAAENIAEHKRQHLAGVNDLNCVYLIQTPSPTVSVPPDLNMAGIAEAGLELAGMSSPDARAFCQTVDWSSTLVVPIPRNSGSYEKVSVDGVEGTLIAETLPQSKKYSLLWIKDGVIYSLMGHGDTSQALDLAASLH